ncbi:MAG: hypothetical protein MHPDNHAH_00474 [Anaerolineales bacterium]|nr:hypothetical protein [Anaerolineales bacterium]
MTEITASAITLVGIMISVGVTLYVGSRQIGAELQKLRVEFQQVYATRLLDKRLETYPEIGYMISGFFKKAKKGDEFILNVPVKELIKLKKFIDKWDSRNYIFMSAYASTQLGEFRDHLSKILDECKEKSITSLKPSEYFLTAMKSGENLEFALKSDLGIYEVDFAHITKRIKAYEDIVKEFSNHS